MNPLCVRRKHRRKVPTVLPRGTAWLVFSRVEWTMNMQLRNFIWIVQGIIAASTGSCSLSSDEDEHQNIPLRLMPNPQRMSYEAYTERGENKAMQKCRIAVITSKKVPCG